MNVSLTPELERYVKKKVASGLYRTASEVVRDSLQMLREREKSLGRDIAAGFADADAGRLAPLNATATLARVRKERASKR